MNNIFNSIKLDYYIFKTFSHGPLLFSVGIATLASIISSSPGLIIGIILMVSAFFMTGMFAVVEKNNINSLYGILPIAKLQIVIGRYLFAVYIGVSNSVISTVIAYFISFILDIKLNSLTLMGWLCGSFSIFCVLVSMQFPIYFRYEFEKVSSIANMPAIILFIIASALITKRPELFKQTVHFFINNQYMIWLIGIVGALLLLGVSMLLSYVLSKKRDL